MLRSVSQLLRTASAFNLLLERKSGTATHLLHIPFSPMCNVHVSNSTVVALGTVPPRRRSTGAQRDAMSSHEQDGDVASRPRKYAERS